MATNILKMLAALLCAAGLLFMQPALAVDYAFSGFGTIGYTQSNQDFKYLRSISKSGTFLRDTVLGAQMDARFDAGWGATVQAKLAPVLDRDVGWEPTISWAFLSYRPRNDFLLRIGKLRVPFSLSSENLDVGATFDMARLPVGLYSITPTLDFKGASFGKDWEWRENELSLEGFWGRENRLPARTYIRDLATSEWRYADVEVAGLVLTLRQKLNTFRIGYTKAEAESSEGIQTPVTLVPGTLPPGITGTYYRPSNQTISTFSIPVFNLGADVALGQGFRAIGEYVRRKVEDTNIVSDIESFYLSLLKKTGHWTPYITYAQTKSKNLDLYRRVNNARVQPLVPAAAIPAALINASQRFAADNIEAYDQNSVSIGTSYSLTTTSKVKAEWSVVRTGDVSNFVDAPVGGESANLRINVLSLSYSFVF